MEISPLTLLVLVGSLSAAALVNGMIGFGYALLAVNVLAVILGAKGGIIVLSLLTPVLSGSQVWRYRAHRPTVRRLWPLVLGALAGTAVGAQILVFLPGYAISLALGLFTVLHVLRELRGRRPPMASTTERRLAPMAGFVGGVSNGTLGASGPVLGSYLLAIGLRGGEFVLGISIVFFAMSIARNIVLMGLGQYTLGIVFVALILIVPSFVGQRVGFWFRGRLPAPTVERGVLVILLLASLNLLYRGLSGLLTVAA